MSQAGTYGAGGGGSGNLAFVTDSGTANSVASSITFTGDGLSGNGIYFTGSGDTVTALLNYVDIQNAAYPTNFTTSNAIITATGDVSNIASFPVPFLAGAFFTMSGGNSGDNTTSMVGSLSITNADATSLWNGVAGSYSRLDLSGASGGSVATFMANGSASVLALNANFVGTASPIVGASWNRSEYLYTTGDPVPATLATLIVDTAYGATTMDSPSPVNGILLIRDGAGANADTGNYAIGIRQGAGALENWSYGLYMDDDLCATAAIRLPGGATIDADSGGMTIDCSALDLGPTAQINLGVEGTLVIDNAGAVTTATLADGELAIGVTGSAPVAGAITSLDASITVTLGAGTIDLSVAGGGGDLDFATDSGTATSASSSITFTGDTTSGNGIFFSGAGDTVTATMTFLNLPGKYPDNYIGNLPAIINVDGDMGASTDPLSDDLWGAGIQIYNSNALVDSSGIQVTGIGAYVDVPAVTYNYCQAFAAVTTIQNPLDASMGYVYGSYSEVSTQALTTGSGVPTNLVGAYNTISWGYATGYEVPTGLIAAMVANVAPQGSTSPYPVSGILITRDTAGALPTGEPAQYALGILQNDNSDPVWEYGIYMDDDTINTLAIRLPGGASINGDATGALIIDGDSLQMGSTFQTNLGVEGALVVDNTGAITTATLADGELAIGVTGGAPVAGAITSLDASVTVTLGAGTIDLSVAGGSGFSWSEDTTTSIALAVDQGYISTNASPVTATLPATAALGSYIRVLSNGTGLVTIAQNSGQTVHFNGSSTTTGVAGSLTAVAQYASIELLCTVANTTFVVVGSVGNWTVA